MSWRKKLDKPVKLSDLLKFDRKKLKNTTTSVRHRDGSITTENIGASARAKGKNKSKGKKKANKSGSNTPSSNSVSSSATSSGASTPSTSSTTGRGRKPTGFTLVSASAAVTSGAKQSPSSVGAEPALGLTGASGDTAISTSSQSNQVGSLGLSLLDADPPADLSKSQSQRVQPVSSLAANAPSMQSAQSAPTVDSPRAFYPFQAKDLKVFKRKAFSFDPDYDSWQVTELNHCLRPFGHSEISIASIIFNTLQPFAAPADTLKQEFDDLLVWLERIQPSVIMFSYISGYWFRFLMQLPWIRKYYQSSDTEMGSNTSQWRMVVFSKINVVGFECSLLFSPHEHSGGFYEKHFLLNTKIRVLLGLSRSQSKVGRLSSLHSVSSMTSSSSLVKESEESAILQIMCVKYDRADRQSYALQLQQIFKHLKQRQAEAARASKDTSENDEKGSEDSGGSGGSGGMGGYEAIINGSAGDDEKLGTDRSDFDCILIGPMCDLVQMVPNEKFSTFRHCERLLAMEEVRDSGMSLMRMESKSEQENDDSSDSGSEHNISTAEAEYREAMRSKRLVKLKSPICSLIHSKTWRVAMIDEWDWLEYKRSKEQKQENTDEKESANVTQDDTGKDSATKANDNETRNGCLFHANCLYLMQC